ncbi:hypothetical protein CYMTET_5398 [Cymbomonas tetramitiformis]|uniref:CBM20 domain-containing protein n=1 Tax=Cymbomonas tetramitiformis TaxID=36881 RepID=A0AAE0GZJ3_9CHLO|nr:hypothetical protein CYMTET_5398 [Cymbomonas tetramitiformis]
MVRGALALSTGDGWGSGNAVLLQAAGARPLEKESAEPPGLMKTSLEDDMYLELVLQKVGSLDEQVQKCAAKMQRLEVQRSSAGKGSGAAEQQFLEQKAKQDEAERESREALRSAFGSVVSERSAQERRMREVQLARMECSLLGVWRALGAAEEANVEESGSAGEAANEDVSLRNVVQAAAAAVRVELDALETHREKQLGIERAEMKKAQAAAHAAVKLVQELGVVVEETALRERRVVGDVRILKDFEERMRVEMDQDAGETEEAAIALGEAEECLALGVEVEAQAQQETKAARRRWRQVRVQGQQLRRVARRYSMHVQQLQAETHASAASREVRLQAWEEAGVLPEDMNSPVDLAPLQEVAVRKEEEALIEMELRSVGRHLRLAADESEQVAELLRLAGLKLPEDDAEDFELEAAEEGDGAREAVEVHGILLDRWTVQVEAAEVAAGALGKDVVRLVEKRQRAVRERLEELTVTRAREAATREFEEGEDDAAAAAAGARATGAAVEAAVVEVNEAEEQLAAAEAWQAVTVHLCGTIETMAVRGASTQQMLRAAELGAGLGADAHEAALREAREWSIQRQSTLELVEDACSVEGCPPEASNGHVGAVLDLQTAQWESAVGRALMLELVQERALLGLRRARASMAEAAEALVNVETLVHSSADRLLVDSAPGSSAEEAAALNWSVGTAQRFGGRTQRWFQEMMRLGVEAVGRTQRKERQLSGLRRESEALRMQLQKVRFKQEGSCYGVVSGAGGQLLVAPLQNDGYHHEAGRRGILVTFNIQYKAQYGMQLMLLTSQSGWSLEKGHLLNWAQDHRWSISVRLPSSTAVMYKYALVQEKSGDAPHEAVAWQPGANNTIMLPGRLERHDMMVVCEDKWKGVPLCGSVKMVTADGTVKVVDNDGSNTQSDLQRQADLGARAVVDSLSFVDRMEQILDQTSEE